MVLHTAVLAYLTTEERERFRRAVMRLEGHWIAVEGPTVVPGIRTPGQSPVSGAGSSARLTVVFGT